MCARAVLDGRGRMSQRCAIERSREISRRLVPRIFADDPSERGDQINVAAKGRVRNAGRDESRALPPANHFSAALEVVALAFPSASGGDRTMRLATERLLCCEFSTQIATAH